MGSWFSNLHVRKNGKITEDSVAECIGKIMASQQYLPVESAEEADGAFAIVSGDKSQWYSVYSDLFSFDKPKLFTDYAKPMSAELKTEILGVSCFDSDFLFLNLIDTVNKVNAWAGIGRAAGFGIHKRTNLAAWKNKVDDYSRFKESLKKDFVFAEEVFAEIECCIHLPEEYGVASYEYLDDFVIEETASFLYFKLPDPMKMQAETPKLVQDMSSLMPCALDKPSIVCGINVGGASKGLSVYFIGPYVEHEEITFSNVCFVQEGRDVPIELKKVQLSDGQWAYCYHDPGYKIPPKVDERLPRMKQIRVKNERSIVVRFIPHGNPRKILDITVVLVPDKNPQGQTGWNVWHRFGSKKAYMQLMRLREEDYD